MQVFESLLKPFVENGILTILTEHFPVSAEANGDKIAAVTLENLQDNKRLTVSAEYFIDATELGELLPLTGTEFVTGSESRTETGEPSAKEIAQPNNSQAFSMCFALDYHAGENHTIEKPENYDFWRDFVPSLTPPWSGKLLSLTGLSPRDLQPVHYNFQPNNELNKCIRRTLDVSADSAREKFHRGRVCKRHHIG